MTKKCILIFLILVTMGITTALAGDLPEQISDVTTVEITQTTEFIFTPEVTGYWVFRTSDNGDYNPELWIRNMYGTLIAHDDHSGGNFNALITVHLVGGVDYVVGAGFRRGGVGQYTLSVYLVDRFVRPPNPWDDWDWRDPWQTARVPITIPGEGGSFVTEELMQEVYFTPDTTGLWAFDISGLHNARIYDPLGNELRWISSLRAEPDAFITLHLVEGVQYRMIIHADMNSMLVSGTIYYTETMYQWLENVTLENLAIILEGEYVQIEAGVQDLQGGPFFTFVPPESGFWRFEVVEREAGAGRPHLTVADRDISFFVDTWDQWRYANPAVTVYLAEGFEYLLFVEAFDFTDDELLYQGNFTLSVTQYDFEVPSQAGETAQIPPPPPPPPPVETEQPNLPQVNIISPTGGQYDAPAIPERTVFSFTPDVTGTWVLQTGGDSTVRIRDGSSSFSVDMWPRALTISLAAGVEYFIYVDTWGVDCVLFVSPYHQMHNFAPGMGIERRVIREAEFSFIPSETGIWVI